MMDAHNSMKIKKSYGIALCRYAPTGINHVGPRRMQTLMVKKRFTYQFFEFVFGRYKPNDTKHLMYLFNNMTYAEKICILNMKFSDMWYKIWLSDPEKSYFYGYGQIRDGILSARKPSKALAQEKGLGAYFKKKNKFESAFVKDSGKRLLDMIEVSSNSEAPWDIPKGHKNLDEQDLNAAVREFEEETGVDPKNYTILWDAKPIITTYQSWDGNIYKHHYYLAKTEGDWNPKVSFKKYSQVIEIECVKWVTMNDIQFLQLNPEHHKRMVSLVGTLTKVFKKYATK